MLQKSGVSNDTILVLYGDFNNWFAAFAFWVFKYYGYKDIRLMNGGRKKWLEEDRPISKEVQQYPKGNFKASQPDNSIRVFLNEVKDALSAKDRVVMVDVRSPKEFTGEVPSSSRVSNGACTERRAYTQHREYTLEPSCQ